jgi:hypothetical protein
MPGVMDPADSQFLQEHLFLWAYGQRPRIICRTIATGEVVYEQDAGQSARFLSPPGRGPSTHVVLLENQDTFGGFGLVSGKFLWSRKKPAPSPGRRSSTYINTMGGLFVQGGVFIHPAAVAATQAEAYGGVLVVSPDAGTVWVLDAATGETIWERTVRRRAFTMARSVGAYVALVLDGGADLWVCDARTGRRLSQNRFAPPSYRVGRSIMSAGQGLLCQFYDLARGAQSAEYRELPSGRVVWSTEGSRATRGMWLVDGATVAFLAADGSLELKAIATGVVRCRISADQVNVFQPIDLALDARRGHLYVSGQGRNGGQQLRIFDLASGEAAGAFDFGGASPYRRRMPAALYAQCGDLLPWIEQEFPTKDPKGGMRSHGTCTVRFLRRSDGKAVEGLTLPSSQNNGTFTWLNQIYVQNGAAILLMNEGMEVIGHAAGPNK